jgi:hypothetical protein
MSTLLLIIITTERFTNLTRFLSFTAILLSLTPLTSVYSLLQTFAWIESDTPSFAGMDASISTMHQTEMLSRAAANMNMNMNGNVFLTYNASNVLDQANLLEPRIHVGNKDHYDAPYPLLLAWILSIILGISIPLVALLYDAYLRITQTSRRIKRRQRITKALRPCRKRVTTKSQEKETCAICLASYSLGETIVRSSNTSECRHCFHETCMMTWLVKHQKESFKRQNRHAHEQCPCCRQSFVTIPSR